MNPGPDIPWLDDGVPPIALTPCPEGWREVTGGDVIECDPYPEAGPEPCGPGEAHFPGESGCRSIGDPCGMGDFATGLPTEGLVVHVNAGSPAGGDGSLAAPYVALSEVNWVSLAPGTTVALGGGSYEGTLPLKAGVHVVGKCVADTLLTGLTAPVPSVVTVTTAGAAAVVRNVTLSETPQPAVTVQAGRALGLDGVLIDRSRTFGLGASGDGAAVTLLNVVIRDTQPRASDSSFGRGMNITRGARVDATRLIVERSHEVGIGVFHSGTLVRLEDTVVRDTQPSAIGGRSGRGLDIADGAELDATGLLVTRNHQAGIFVGDGGTSVTLTDAIVRDTEPQASDNTAGHGISLQGPASLVATRLVVAGNRENGISASLEGSAVTLTDTVVRDMVSGPGDTNQGRGLNIQLGAHLETARLLVTRSRDVGIFVGTDLTRTTLTDTAVRDTVPRPGESSRGRGINVQDGARLEATRLVIAQSHEVGLMVIAGGDALVGDFSLTGVEQADCASTTCPERTAGYGAAVASGTLDIRNFRVREAVTCGVFAALAPSGEASSLDLSSGIVSGSRIGACVQVAGYDLDRLTDNVQYQDNVRNLDSTTLPVPPLVNNGGP